MGERRPGTEATVPQLLTVAEVATILAISRRSVWSLIALGKLKRVKLGPRTTRVDPASVQELIDRGSRAAG